jgi:hypothetical protein
VSAGGVVAVKRASGIKTAVAFAALGCYCQGFPLEIEQGDALIARRAARVGGARFVHELGPTLDLAGILPALALHLESDPAIGANECDAGIALVEVLDLLRNDGASAGEQGNNDQGVFH